MALDLQLRASFAWCVKDAEESMKPGGDPSHKVQLALRGKRGLEAAVGLLKRARAQVCTLSLLLSNIQPFTCPVLVWVIIFVFLASL